MIAALEGVGVRRHTTGQVVLDAVEWTVRSGEHWALLGANGAGKTTVLHLIGALMFPTVGAVEVLGHRLGSVDVRELRAVIGAPSRRPSRSPTTWRSCPPPSPTPSSCATAGYRPAARWRKS